MFRYATHHSTRQFKYFFHTWVITYVFINRLMACSSTSLNIFLMSQQDKSEDLDILLQSIERPECGLGAVHLIHCSTLNFGLKCILVSRSSGRLFRKRIYFYSCTRIAVIMQITNPFWAVMKL